MKTIETNSLIIFHEGKRLPVLFLHDYLKVNKTTRFAVQKKIAAFELYQLEIFGRKRLKNLIVTDPPGELLESIIVSEENGSFTIWDGYRYAQVMFVDQYAANNNLSKQAIDYQLEKGILDGYQYQRANGNKVNFVFCSK